MKQTRSMSEKIDVPIICISDDDEDDDLNIDKSYKSLLDNLTDDNSLSPLFKSDASDLDRPRRYEADDGKSETRKFDTFSGHSKRSRLDNETKNRVSQQRKRETGGFKGENPRAFPITIENIQRDNRIAERRKRRIAELEAASVSRGVPLTNTRRNIQRDNGVSERRKRRVAELETARISKDVPFVRNHESIQRDGRVGKFSEYETVGDAPFVQIEEDIQRDNKVSEGRNRKAKTLRKDVSLVRIEKDNKIAETMVVNETSKAVPVELNPVNETSRTVLEAVSRAVPLVRNHESFRRNDKVRKYSELEDKTSGDAPLVRTEENIQRGDKVSEGTKRKAETLRKVVSLVIIEEDNRIAETMVVNETPRAELEAARVSRAVPLVRHHESFPRNDKAGKFSGLEDETLGDASLVRTEEVIQRDNKVSEGRKRKAETLRKDFSLVIIEEDNGISETRVVNETSKAVPMDLNLVNEPSRIVQVTRTEEDIQRDNKVSEGRKRKAETLTKDVSFVRIEEDNRIAETMVVNETSKAVPMDLNPVNEPSRTVQVTEVDKGVFAGRRKSHEKSVKIVDRDYMSYLTWLVDSLKDAITKPISNLQKDLSELDPPITDTGKTITMVPEENLPVEVKVEQDLEPWSTDDSDIIAIGDSPFLDGEDTPFVTSKSVIIDLDKERSKQESSCWFRKELMNDLKRPYNEVELRRLYREASIHRRKTRSRELRKGRETDYETDELGMSYLERFDDFDKVYRRVNCNDKARLLKLLRGFFFYLKHVSHDGAFKPWMDPP